MEKLLALIAAFAFFSQPALAVTVLGESFTAYANSLTGSGGSLLTDTGNSTTGTKWTSDPTTIANYISDTDAETWILGISSGAYVDLAFDQAVADATGMDLKIFFVGSRAHSFQLGLFGTGGLSALRPYSIAAGVGYTGNNTSAWGDPINAMQIDLADFTGFNLSSINGVRIVVGDGYDLANSAVPSFVGAYSVAAVPIPATLWLFGSGLVGLAGLLRRKR